MTPLDIADRIRFIVSTCITVHDYERKLQDLQDDLRRLAILEGGRMNLVEPQYRSAGDPDDKPAVEVLRERDEALERLDELWKAIKEMQPDLGNANKPLAIAASYALLKNENGELRKERDQERVISEALEAEIKSLNTKLAARVQEINFLQRQVEVGCALNDIKYEQWSHFCEAIPQNITLWVDRCPHCGMPREQ